jgi:BirA family biotin operon repressor/biotin-[acetyl-CoA-carboxylase] ligase
VSDPSWLISLPTCDSTNTWALAHAEALAHGACVFTTSQTAGRGRGNKAWLSPPGVLTASCVLALTDGLAARQVALAAGLAVAHAVEDFAPRARVQIKWPNDCLVDDRKLAGILCERTAGEDRMVVGIGLNVDPQWDQLPQELPFAVRSTASIAECMIPGDKRGVPAATDVLARVRKYLLEAAGLVAADGFAKLLQPLKVRDNLRGKRVTVVDGTATMKGVACGFDTEGRLLVGEGGEQQACSGGTVTFAEGVAQTARSSRWFRNDRRSNASS